ncbi:dihydrolipoyl dehydrogenase family protein [Litorimonas sp.]|jgi:glutathione reductase (NADPH)|uniref:dihydrolipoyl dehydrogenase family protein n=1 Tax=Litorimonas sp. TaxID=1892381 RepID=UPI003A8B717A
MQIQKFDLIVLGVGMAAVNAANKCASAGWKVAVIDELPYGGTCALRGCDPKKMLRRGAEIIDAATLMKGKGIEAGNLAINWSGLLAFKRTFTEKMPPKIESGLDKKGVTTLHGNAKFVAENVIEIDGETRLEGKNILIATGAKPREMSMPGAEYLTESTEFLELEILPKKIIFVGGGFISFEFAHIAARAGSDVYIIDRGERPLKGFEVAHVNKLLKRSAEARINFTPLANLVSITPQGDGYSVVLDTDGKQRSHTADLIVHGAGRTPAIDNLDLDKAGIEFGTHGVAVNDYLQSKSNPAVYAAGDAADTKGLPLTPVAVFEGKVAASNMMRGNHIKPDYNGVPTVVFTIPELARVGMTEEEAKAAGYKLRIATNDTSNWYSNLRIGETCAATKVIIDDETDKILGAHLLGPEYAEIINFFSLAIRLQLTASDLKKMVSAYPSVGSDLGSML